MDISVAATLRYTLSVPTYFVLQVQAAQADGQIVKSENLTLPPNSRGVGFEAYVDPVTDTRRVRCLIDPGEVTLQYSALVTVATGGFLAEAVREFDFGELPMGSIDYLVPSRYCPSDTFTDFAGQTFGSLPRGHTRVTAVCDWIFNHIRYEAGSTGPATNAADVFQSGKGVCRDFAHLGISLCRALGIPARYASVYADQLTPQDFHAVFQAYLCGPNGGQWFTFDPTRMSSADAVVRIAAGQDAADVAFAWPQGEVVSQPPQIEVRASGRATTERTALAVGR